MCAGIVTTFSAPVFTWLVIVDQVEGWGERAGVGSTAGCCVALSSDDFCLGSSFMILALVATLAAFTCLRFLEFLGGSLAFGGGSARRDLLP